MNFRKIFSSMDVVITMYTCIYHDVDVGNTIGISFSHCVSCLLVIHTIRHR